MTYDGPPGQYAPPASRRGLPGSEYPRVNPLDWGILGAGALAFIFSFFDYYHYTGKSHGTTVGTFQWNAWHGFFGWFGMLVALAGSALVALDLLAPQLNLAWRTRSACLFAYALATLCLILAILIIPDPFAVLRGAYGVSTDKGHGYAFWISFIVILAGLGLSLVRIQQTRDTRPAQQPQGWHGQLSQYGPHPGQYSPSPEQQGAPRPGVDLSKVNPLDWGIFAAGLIAFIFSFISFYTVKNEQTLSGSGLTLATGSENKTAWHGFFGWFAVVLALAAAVLVAVDVFIPQVRLRFSSRLVALGSFDVALLLMIVAVFVTPNQVGRAFLAPLGIHIDYGRGFGFWVVFIAIAAGTVLSFIRAQQTVAKLPGPLAEHPGHRSAEPAAPSA